MMKNMRCPLGKSSNEIVVKVYQGRLLLLKLKIIQFLCKLIFLLKVVAVPSGCTYDEKYEVPLGKV